ncbi:DUF427 domain-containing protein [Candidatus Woesearchaeota archaeon]|nr:DUF427 domain-containing protein [Candidatus Woesearchaeota archaeon]MBT4150572.1 DUF427 domain-containing protein [Candidatus Woesearchaeota archaeon]MBT4247681.1 DUF427 domain-containing protein [Candidatus Woesearchaeota archaeon]MBT4434039.1 DUF427 domain-containing protein [Candidatus Woesearchaeota archaeon]MBT7332251.1 DUF427 domain-containing protein [Candidatus Woesearchaeota archaeon]
MTKATWNGKVIAESNETIEIEGNQYFPAKDVNKEFLDESEHHTTCPWKGVASYYNVVVDGKVNENAAWFYPKPKDGSIEKVGRDFTGYIAFWNGVEII